MAAIRCIITDDEPFARKGLQGYVEKTPFLQLVAVCEDAMQLHAAIRQCEPQLIFLDIEMPYLTGIDFLKSEARPPRVIFTTAYEQYALEGYDLNVLDYLLKPISFERFLRAANKALDFFQASASAVHDHMFVRVGGRLEKVVFSDLYFIEARENYVALYLRDTKHIVHATLKSIHQQLPPALFVQPHKSYLVNINAIQSVEGSILNVHQYQVPISKYQKDSILEQVVNNKLLNR